MSALSFREQAAIAILGALDLVAFAAGDGPPLDPHDFAVGAAQALANRCCARWGHRIDVGLPIQFCERCGANSTAFACIPTSRCELGTIGCTLVHAEPREEPKR